MSILLYTPSQDVHLSAEYPLTRLVCWIPPHTMSHCMHVTAHLLQIVYRYVVLHSDDVQLSPCHSTFTSCTTVCKSYHIVTSCTIVCHCTLTRCRFHKMSKCLYVTAHSQDIQPSYITPCTQFCDVSLLTHTMQAVLWCYTMQTVPRCLHCSLTLAHKGKQPSVQLHQSQNRFYCLETSNNTKWNKLQLKKRGNKWGHAVSSVILFHKAS